MWSVLKCFNCSRFGIGNQVCCGGAREENKLVLCHSTCGRVLSRPVVYWDYSKSVLYGVLGARL